ncbi:hypothetical protein BU26DRAFT_4528 [Trematosphaeria pertusa]|uniref:Uncharacterized protein n=1 Tax=Trematosphaeria pertusa TaxID=390896 RepID=A0A6A6J0E8_9PLEO|nr:uncharacterized protein BU26DRAFT_4528 [Trematosphaeria pertusa]KAF2255622.1 hypothetical protein BU26DRAFT_4528 [Trematosphaeria pertusa]
MHNCDRGLSVCRATHPLFVAPAWLCCCVFPCWRVLTSGSRATYQKKSGVETLICHPRCPEPTDWSGGEREESSGSSGKGSTGTDDWLRWLAATTAACAKMLVKLPRYARAACAGVCCFSCVSSGACPRGASEEPQAESGERHRSSEASARARLTTVDHESPIQITCLFRVNYSAYQRPYEGSARKHAGNLLLERLTVGTTRT